MTNILVSETVVDMETMVDSETMMMIIMWTVMRMLISAVKITIMKIVLRTV